MNISDVYIDYPELMTAEEKEEMNFHPDDGEIPSIPRWFLNLVLSLPPPDDVFDDKVKFEQRGPALGLTKSQIQELQNIYSDPRLLSAQKRILFDELRSHMLRQLISCSGCKTVPDLIDILKKESESGIPSPVPDWYEFSKTSHGPRKTGYDKCDNRGCYVTEDVDRKILRCSACQLAHFCSKECQKEDWNARHKKMCKRAKRERLQTAKAGDVLSMFNNI